MRHSTPREHPAASATGTTQATQGLVARLETDTHREGRALFASRRLRSQLVLAIGVLLLVVAGRAHAHPVTVAARDASISAASRDAVSGVSRRTFSRPPSAVRPMYRGWMPLAYTDDDVLRAELRDLAASGAGGVEVVPFVVPGAGNQSNEFLAVYGWGTPRWAHKMEVITGAAADLGLIVDQNLGPHYPPTVPTLDSFNQPEAEQQLIFGREFNQPGTTRAGALPAPTTAPPSVSTRLCQPASPGQRSLYVESLGGFAPGDVVTLGAAATAENVIVQQLGDRTASCGALHVSQIVNVHSPTDALTNTARTTRIRTLVAQCAGACSATTPGSIELVRSSVQDVTDRVISGALEYEFPAGNGNPWVVIDFLQTASGLIAQRGGYTATQPNYVVDHWSRRGAQIQADFWDEHVLTDAVRANLERIGGGAVFEDSLELGSTQKWTWGFLEDFSSLRGYDPTVLLPALTGIGVQGIAVPAFEIAGIGPQVREDYRQTLSDLYVDRYVAVMQAWANSRGLQFRVQPYGMPIAAAVASAAAGVPEGESLGFALLRDVGAEQGYRVLSSGAHFAGRNVVSTECCAVFLGNYRSSVAGPQVEGAIGGGGDGSQIGGRYSQGLLDSVYKSYAGGVNQLVWHGFPYRDAPVGVGASGRDGSWPGYHPWDIFGALNVNDEFGPRQPSWPDHAAINDALARTQLVLRQGRSVVDLGVYHDPVGVSDPSTDALPQHFLGTASATSSAGYTYDYLAPAFLDDPSARVGTDGSLSAGSSKVKALILKDQRTVSLAGAARLLSLAQQGLRLFVIGEAPSSTRGAEPDGDRLAPIVDALLRQTTVRRVPSENEMPSALDEAGIRPAVMPETSSADLGFVRRETGQVTYDFIYNRSGSVVERKLHLTGSGRPCVLNTWAGRIEPIALYDRDARGVSVRVRVAPHDIVIVALADELAAPGTARDVHPTSSTGTVVAPFGKRPVLRAERDGRYSTTFSDGTTDTSDVTGLSPGVALDAWQLRAQTWTPGQTQYSTVKTNQPELTVTAGQDGRLPSWLEILAPVDLSRSSGVGTYSTSIDLPRTWKRTDGAYLSLGDVLDTAHVTVNGRRITVNQSDRGRIDLGRSLRAGRNDITVRVATTMFNAVRASGDGNYRLPDWQRTGLMGPVVLTPYRDIELRHATPPRLPRLFR